VVHRDLALVSAAAVGGESTGSPYRRVVAHAVSIGARP